MGINQMIENLENLNIKDVVLDSIEATKSEIVEYQKGQMLQGKNRDNELIGDYADPDYKRKKQNMNPLAEGHVDLKYTGEFQRNITIQIFSTSLQIYSTDSKNALLIEMYGDKIFGLNIPFKTEYNQLYLKPEFASRIRKALNSIS